VINEKNIKETIVAGDVGRLEMRNIVEELELLVGIRTVMPNSVVPKKPHSHVRRQINYIVDGEPTVTNGKQTIQLKKGDFVLFGSFEEHYFSTTDKIMHVFEVQFR
jgi:mannose-6-phosphate isomerase-like protein (cupin superfamily)